MGIKKSKRGGSEKIKMPQVEVDMEAIEEIKRRKKRSRKRKV
jgi:hypothetical protein